MASPTGVAQAPQRSFDTAVDRFYASYLDNNLAAFNSFALQSRSELARCVYARAASEGCHDSVSLQLEIDELLRLARDDETVLRHANYKLPVLLSLASFLLDTAQSDLDTHNGLQILRLVLLKHGSEALSLHQQLQFVEALGSQGDYAEQAELAELFDLKKSAPLQAELLAVDRVANQDCSPESWLRAMNAFYMAHGMHPIRLKPDTSLPLLDRLTADPQEKLRGPLVSVIVPTYSPDERIFTAIDSLVRQTWSDLEILIVDDGSPDTSDAILTRVEGLDSRIRVIRQETNGGAYTARNAGLAEARGEYVTTHDDDDWSHPEKIATQAAALTEDDSLVATTAAHIRTTQDMHFRRINAKPRHLQTNYSSLMFRKAITDRVGGWDTSKRGSDTELVDRIKAHYGKSAIVNLTNKPLSFSRVWDGSLTSGEIYRGYFAYSRLLYRWSFRQWHRETKRQGAKPILKNDEPRPFAIPTTFEPANKDKDLGLFDVIYVTDYARASKFSDDVIYEIDSAQQSGLRVGYMHINSPQTFKRGDISPRLFDLQLEGRVTQIAENDKAETRLMVVYDSAIGMFLDQFKSTVQVQRGIVVQDGGAGLRTSQPREASHIATSLRNLDRSFGIRFKTVGATHDDQEQLRTQVPSGRLLSDTFLWRRHITTNRVKLRKPSEQPVVGFHSFGNKYRWPSNRTTFESVYELRDMPVLFYGNIEPVRKHLGRDIIQDGQYVDPSKASLTEFFDEIDFWVHFPHERLRDRPWSGVFEAIQAGKVIILPPHLEKTYGDAAVYAEPEDVSTIVAEYSGDPERYMEQAQRGQSYTELHYSRASYLSRVRQLAGLDKAK